MPQHSTLERRIYVENAMNFNCWLATGHIVRLLSIEDFISLFSRMSCHLKCFETTNETIPKMHDFILKFH
jgi:hypothetical protein